MSLWMFFCKAAEAQFIRLTLNIPVGFDMNVGAGAPVVIEPLSEASQSASQIKASGASKGVGKPLRWIEMRSRENVPFSLAFRPEFSGSRPAGLFEVYYLNDGSTNFNQAVRLNQRRNVLQFFSLPKLMADMPQGTPYFTAWLGVPANRGGVITIEYQ
jgi:hypothetical protein